ncbi:hypothetical protein CIJ90_26500, partial [Escherichia coli]|uniref:hypothetical protein n=1 Tax=Escherichia coli TaxID=562 RepID=UPI000BCBD5AD
FPRLARPLHEAVLMQYMIKFQNPSALAKLIPNGNLSLMQIHACDGIFPDLCGMLSVFIYNNH